ncbi:MAG: DUF1905 domain-containing protein [Aureispira sp.]|nr:DUF1905 domain-containing protein [Aureispira sp.]
MTKIKSFEAIIESSGRGGAFVFVPFDVEKTFGTKRPKVKVLFEETIEYRGTLTKMKTPKHLLIVRKDIREELGKNVGDSIQIKVELDTEPRVVEVPQLLSAAFGKSPKAKTFYETLSYTCQKEYAQYITEAKRDATKERRTTKVIEMLEAGKKNL